MQKTSGRDLDLVSDTETVALPAMGGPDLANGEGPPLFESVGQPQPVPERTPDYFVCLRGPCRHYWHLETMAQEGNPAGTWEALDIQAPRQHHHTCLVNPGFETSFEDDNVYECSRWDPLTEQELVQIRTRREEYENRRKEETRG